MPTFDTREPISVHLEIGVGEIRITAGDRSDTVVDVGPADPAKKGDVNAAEQTRVDYADGVLRIKSPKGWRHHPLRARNDAIHLLIELPAGSTVQGEAGMATLHGVGRLAQCRFKSGAGDIRIEETGGASLKTGAGDINVGRAVGHCDFATASGNLRFGTIDGTATVKNANGDIHIGEVSRGAVVARTAYGRIDVGIRAGVATWLDLNTAFGKVHSDLEAVERPEPGEDVVELKARTAYGDITIRRSAAAT